jgi:excisionase family DNA binding protein
MNRTLLTAAQVAQLLGVPKSWVYEQSRRGRIPTVTLGRYRRYRLEAIEDWIRNREETDAGTNRASPRPLLAASKGARIAER